MHNKHIQRGVVGRAYVSQIPWGMIAFGHAFHELAKLDGV